MFTNQKSTHWTSCSTTFSKISDLRSEIESFGTTGMVFMLRSASRGGMRPYCGSPRVTNTFSIWTAFEYRPSIPGNDITGAQRKASRQQIPMGRTHQMCGKYFREIGNRAFG